MIAEDRLLGQMTRVVLLHKCNRNCYSMAIRLHGIYRVTDIEHLCSASNAQF